MGLITGEFQALDINGNELAITDRKERLLFGYDGMECSVGPDDFKDINTVLEKIKKEFGL